MRRVATDAMFEQRYRCSPHLDHGQPGLPYSGGEAQIIIRTDSECWMTAHIRQWRIPRASGAAWLMLHRRTTCRNASQTFPTPQTWCMPRRWLSSRSAAVCRSTTTTSLAPGAVGAKWAWMSGNSGAPSQATRISSAVPGKTPVERRCERRALQSQFGRGERRALVCLQTGVELGNLSHLDRVGRGRQVMWLHDAPLLTVSASPLSPGRHRGEFRSRAESPGASPLLEVSASAGSPARVAPLSPSPGRRSA